MRAGNQIKPQGGLIHSNLHEDRQHREAKTHLSKRIEGARNGEPFIIAKSGKPVVKVVPLDSPSGRKIRRPGFMKGRFSVPDDFDRMYSAEIERLLEGGE